MSSIAFFFHTAKLEGFIIHSACNDFNIVPATSNWASLATNIIFFVMISTEFKLGKLALRSCNRGEKGDKFDSHLPFSIISKFTFFSFQVTPAGLS